MGRKILVFSCVVVVIAIACALAPSEARSWVVVNVVGPPIVGLLESTGLIYKVMRHVVDGHTYLRFVNPAENIRLARAYVPADSDIIVATYLQSGTHFMQQIVNQIVTKGTLEFDDIVSISHVLEFHSMAGLPLNVTSPLLGRKVMLTHLYADHMNYSADAAHYVVVIRDPVDRLASSCAMGQLMTGPVRVSCSAMAREDIHVQHDGWCACTCRYLSSAHLAHLAPRCGPRLRHRLVEAPPLLARRSEWVAGWWARRHEKNVLVLFYEDITREHLAHVHKVANFLGLPLDDATAELVRQRSSIEYMKENEERFRPRGVKNAFVRQGVAGGGRAVFSKDEIAEIYKVYGERMKATGSDFDMSRYSA